MADELENASEALLSFKNGLVTDTMKDTIKVESMEEEFGPASLGLHRVGSTPLPKQQPSPHQQPLNRRGVPARIRKKNKLFYDEDDYTPETENSVVPRSMLKTPRVKTTVKKLKKERKESSDPPQPPKNEGAIGDRKLGQKIGMKLRNLLKLPKAQKWVCYEWFYSNIDSSLFGGENDFTVCLKESFPQLKTYLLTRVEWCKMRRMMGKPRRCSQSFFEEERRELERKRSKIRQLQQRKPTDLNSCKDLPIEIPLQLVIGTKVTARLRAPHQDGLFTGSVDAFDTSNNTYRITFERPGLGTHSIPDYEVLANEPVETISVISMIHALRPNRHLSLGPDGYHGYQNDGARDDHPLIQEVPRDSLPTSVLENFVLLNKILEIKKSKVYSLREMNTEAERKRSYSQSLTDDFVRKYASCIVELEHINSTLRQILGTVQSQCQNILPDMSMASYLPSFLRNQSLEEAKGIVNTVKHSVNHQTVLDLVIELTALMLQVKSLSENDRSNYEVEVLSTSMDAIKKRLSPANKNIFESMVEVHLRHIQAGLSGEVGTFSMFMATRP